MAGSWPASSTCIAAIWSSTGSVRRSGRWPAAAGRAGGRAGQGARPDPPGRRVQRRAAERRPAGVRDAARGAARPRRSADRRPGAAGGVPCSGRSRRMTAASWCSSTTCNGPGGPAGRRRRAADEETVAGLLVVGAYRDARRTRRIRSRRCCRAGGPRRRQAPAPGEPAGAERRRRWSRTCSASTGCRGRSGVRDRRRTPRAIRTKSSSCSTRCAARRADCDDRRVALGRGCRARAPGPVRGGRDPGGERADDAARGPAGRRGDGVPRRARRGRRPADRDRHVGGGGRPALAPALDEGVWSSSPASVSRCGSGMTGSARRS